VDSNFVYPVIQIHEYPEPVALPISEIAADEYQVFHKSKFDIWKSFYATFAVQPVVPSVSDVSPVCCVSAESVAQTIINYPYLPVKQTIAGNSDVVASSDVNLGRGDHDIGCSLIASSVGITAEYVAANIKEIKFGSFVLPHSGRKSEDSIKPIYNDRFNRLSNVNGVFSRPRAYERTITIHGETNKRVEYDQLHDQIGPKKALSVYMFYFPDCELSGLDITQRKPGLDRYPYTATFIQRVFDTQDLVSFAGLEFSNVVSVGDVKKSRISDDKYAKAGIAEPRAYQASVEIDCITEYTDEYSNAESRMGSIGNLIINGNTYRNAIITDISGIQQVGGGNAWSYTVSFNWFVFSISDSVSLGTVTLPNILEVSEEKRKPISDDRFAKAGISEPKAYLSDWTISGVFTTDAQFNSVDALIGTNLSVTINGESYADTRITDVSISQYRGGGSVRAYSISLTRYQFNSSDIVTFDNIGMQNVLEIGEEKRSPILNDRLSQAGISEPVAYSVNNTITFVDLSGAVYDLLSDSKVGKSGNLVINGKTYLKSKITNLTKWTPRGGGNTHILTVAFTSYWYSTTDTARFGTITLSNPVLPNAMDITPEYSVEMSTAYNISNPIPIIIRRFAFECITETPLEFKALVNSIGPKLTLVLNGTSHGLCYISSLSGLQPRGGGNIWKYTIEFSQKSGDKPVVAKFNNITLPNAVISSEEDLEILQTRTTLHNGKIAVDLGTTPSRRVSITCMANDKIVYNQLYALIGTGLKYPLIVDDETFTKAYISSWGTARKIGDGDARLYTYTIGFEEETA
jgi:hypothetical protein